METEKRERTILQAVVQSCIQSSAPVGSRTLSKNRLSGLKLSPATIRNTLADLDDQGYLSKPHASSGRIPTEKGYRFYVDELMTAKPLSPSEKRKVSLTVDMEDSNDHQLLENISRLIHTLSKQTGLVLLPTVYEAPIMKICFIKISARRLQVVLIGSFSQVHNILIDVDEDWPESELTELENFINRNYAGCTLKAMRTKLKSKISREHAKYKKFRLNLLKIHEKIMKRRSEIDIIVEGSSSLLDTMNFDNDTKEKMKSLLKNIADKKKMLAILDSCLDNNEVNVNIGSELLPAGLEDCSLVGSSFHNSSGLSGAIGVIGPTCMDYPYIVGLLEYICTKINRRFPA